MKFRWEQGLIWISINLCYEGRDYLIDDCIVDTGAASSAIDIEHIPFNYTKPAVVRQLFGIGGGKQEVVVQAVDAITIDDNKLEEVNIEFGDLNVDYGINGFIGTDLLSLFKVEIDFQEKSLKLTRKESL